MTLTDNGTTPDVHIRGLGVMSATTAATIEQEERDRYENAKAEVERLNEVIDELVEQRRWQRLRVDTGRKVLGIRDDTSGTLGTRVEKKKAE